MYSDIIHLDNLKGETLKDLAEKIKAGSLCVIPTETVYGLAGNGLLSTSIDAIYHAKGRPSDNPLILHVSSMNMVKDITTKIPEDALALMHHFWPGPLTLVLNKKAHVPLNVTGGLDTVAVRMPNLKQILKLIESCGVPLAAPSANISGKPSSTRFKHIFNDFNGIIPTLIDGGDAQVGLESTVLDCTVTPFQILRPGVITPEAIEHVIKKPVAIGLKKEESVKSPGTRYKHYQPKGKVILLDSFKSIEFLEDDHAVCVHTLEDDISSVNLEKRVLGSQKNPMTMNQNLYAVLRDCDHPHIHTIYIVLNRSMSDALLDRLKRASHQEG